MGKMGIRTKMYMVLAGCSAALLLTAGAALLLVHGAADTPDEPKTVDSAPMVVESGYDKDQNIIDTTQYSTTILELTADAGQAYVDETLFLGDSNTARMYRLFDYCTANNAIGSVGMTARSLSTFACAGFQGYSGYQTMAQAVALMQRTAEVSSLAHFVPLQGDLREIRTLLPAHSFRLVTCNPPYFQAGTGYLCPEDSRRRARHEQEESCTIGEVCEAAAWLLQYGGRFCLCQRPERLTDVLSAMRQAGLEPKRLRWVQQRAGKAPWLFLVEGKAGAKPGLTVEPPLLAENADGSYSDEMKTIYRIV